ncbi:hypothetical protein CANINC_000025 [Pichia inconspicua]|uniref:DNA 3'-5' helicase n=1 Tax=Pichia inconspicua TaxID=52247 RepID=A0A4T0X753_9ASCO|nr:hypothetical protein CANINC_000025 [[Candida] inconspicua]
MISYSSENEFSDDGFSENDLDDFTARRNQKKFLKSSPNYSNLSNKLSNLVSVNKLPEMYRSIFSFQNFNRMQSESFNIIFNSNISCVISSPTGSGKTVLFELAITRLLMQKLKAKDDSLLNSKILYMAPTKALCTEKYEDWNNKFRKFNCSVGMLTGDSTLAELDSVKKSTLIICTPEKWDVLTRRWTDYNKLLDLVKLLLVDEVHFIRESRGTTLEVVITRMMTMSLNLRIITVSATVPNISDVSKWLQSNSSTRIKTLVFDDTYRSVKLHKIVYGYRNSGTSNSFQLDAYLNSKLDEVITTHSKGKPILIFCPTRNSTVKTAKFLAQSNNCQSEQINFPKNVSKDIIEMAQKGVAYHNAGLSLQDRKFIEENFIMGKIRILCSTSTLAVGVNLPAYLVIIKGTQTWNNNSAEEYSELDILQMMGRAGRPQFEKDGCCVIMTDGNHKEKYNKLIKGNEKLESSLHLNIFENITAEIQLGTIKSLDSAYTWIQSTFFYQRYLQNPTAYAKVFTKANSSHSLDVQIKMFLKDLIDELIHEQIIEDHNGTLKCTVYGQALSKSYVLYETIKQMIRAKPRLSLKEVLDLVSNSKEFAALRIRHNQKRLYKEINENPLILQSIEPTRLETYSAKASLIIQFELGGLEFPVFQGSVKFLYEFKSEKYSIFKTLPRILKAAVEIFSHKKDAISTNSCLKLNRCISAKCWENTSLVLRQFEGIGITYARKLKSRGITTIQKVKSLDREKIEQYIGLKPGAGQKIAKCIASLPVLGLTINNTKCKSDGTLSFDVQTSIINPSDSLTYVWNGNYTNVYVMVEASGEIVDFRRLPLKKVIDSKSFPVKYKLKHATDFVKVYFDTETIAGIGKVMDVDVSTFKFHLPQKLDLEDEFSDSIDLDNFPMKSIIETKQVVSVKEGVPVECNHKCGDKRNCRHFCCKEGVLKSSIKPCKHACKDKSKCRHMCCRDHYANQQNSNSARAIQKPLDLSSFINVSRTAVEINDESSDPIIFEDQVDSFEEPTTKSSTENKSVSRVPVFLKQIDKNQSKENLSNDDIENQDKTYHKTSTSKYFNFIVDPRHKPKSLLDEPVENGFDGSLESTLDDFFDSKKHHIYGESTTSNKKKHKSTQNQVLKTTTCKPSSRVITDASPNDEIIILSHSMPIVSRFHDPTSVNSHNKPIVMQDDQLAESVVMMSNEGDSTQNTSVGEILKDKNEFLNFLDSDIEY